MGLSPIAGDLAAIINKMRQVKAAALAPAQPSTADKNAAAGSHIAQAKAELMQANEPKPNETKENKANTNDKPPTNQTSEAKSAAPSTTDIPTATPATKSQSAIATDTPTVKDANGEMMHRNQMIAGVYGKAAQSQQLLSLA